MRTGLYKPFATTKASGLGVGLTQCKSIVEAHGGTIVVRSQPGEGTTFDVRVPMDGPGLAPGTLAAPLGVRAAEWADLPGLRGGTDA